jgi:hypothetical protein
MLSLLQEDFEEYAEKAKTLPESTSNENKLILYGLFKQATVGDVNTCKDTQYSLITTQLIFLSVFLHLLKILGLNPMIQYYACHG